MKKSESPLYGGPKLLHGSIGTYKKPKKENSDYVSIMVKMCSNEPQTNPYDIQNQIDSQLWTP